MTGDASPRPVVTVHPEAAWVPLPIVAGAATVATILLSRGSLTSVVLPCFAVLALTVALGPPVPALVMLIVVSSLDGILKGVATGWFTLLFKDLVLWLAVVRWLVLRNRSNQYARVPGVATVAIMAVFLLWVLAEGTNVFTSNWLAALAGIRSWIGWLPVFFVAYEGLHDRRDLLCLCTSLVVAAGAVGAYGVVQQSLGYEHLLAVSPGFGYVETLGLGGDRYRAMSTLPHPGMFGHYVATVLPLGIAVVFAPFLVPRLRLLSALCIVGMASGALASGGRLATAALITCATLVLLLVRQMRIFLLGVLIIGLVALGAVRLVASESIDRVSALFDLAVTVDRVVQPLRQGIESVVAYPLGTGVATGVGVGRATQLLGDSAEVQGKASGMIEGDFGRAFRELGLPGGVLFLYLIIHVLVQGLRAHQSVRDPRWQVMTGALFVMLVSEILGLLVGPAFYLMPVAALFWIAYAGLLRSAQTEPPREEPSTRETLGERPLALTTSTDSTGR